MSDLGKKVGYLKGLMESMDLSNDPSGGKLLAAMADLLSEISDRVESMEELLDDLNDYVESIDDDLSALENERGEGNFRFMDDEEDDDYLDDLAEGEDQLHLLSTNAEEDDEDGPTLCGAVCPVCEKMFFVDLRDPEDAVYVCPHCSERVHPNPLTPENAPIARPE